MMATCLHHVVGLSDGQIANRAQGKWRGRLGPKVPVRNSAPDQREVPPST
jgi:hypothetical protein